jgi:toxin ParE1/3/4
MTTRRAAVLRRPRAEEDIVETVTWLRENASPRVAVEFVDALERTVTLLSRHPLAGSPMVGTRLQIPGLRSLPIPETPYLVFYLGRAERVEIIRVLHGRRDIDARLIGD